MDRLLLPGRFQDVGGARWLPDLRLRLGVALPRLTPSAVLESVGLRGPSLAPASDDALRAGGVERLVAAVAAAHALPAGLSGRMAEVVTARRAVARLAQACGLTAADVAWALHVTPQAVGRLRCQPAPDALLRAARVRHALVERLARMPLLPAPPA